MGRTVLEECALSRNRWTVGAGDDGRRLEVPGALVW
jgi:hypothetical protein